MPFDFVGSLPTYCANKRALVRILGEHLPGKYSAHLFNIPLNTFYTYVESKKEQLNMHLLLATQLRRMLLVLVLVLVHTSST